jgi:hypothetical protein
MTVSIKIDEHQPGRHFFNAAPLSRAVHGNSCRQYYAVIDGPPPFRRSLMGQSAEEVKTELKLLFSEKLLAWCMRDRFSKRKHNVGDFAYMLKKAPDDSRLKEAAQAFEDHKTALDTANAGADRWAVHPTWNLSRRCGLAEMARLVAGLGKI